MSEILLDDVLMQLSLDAYRVAGQITTRTHESRTDGSRRLRPGSCLLYTSDAADDCSIV